MFMFLRLRLKFSPSHGMCVFSHLDGASTYCLMLPSHITLIFDANIRFRCKVTNYFRKFY